jgi:hypothetical protein
MFGKKKKAWFAKNFAFKNHVLGMKLKALFSKCVFDKSIVRKWVTKRILNLIESLWWTYHVGVKSLSAILCSSKMMHIVLNLIGKECHFWMIENRYKRALLGV